MTAPPGRRPEHARPDAPERRAVRPHTVRVTAVVVGVLLTGACSQDAPTPAGTPDGASSPSPTDSPLAEYMGDLWTPDAATVVAEQREIEELVAQCMADEGFEYTVPDVEAQLGEPGALSVTDTGTRDWIAEHGYGLATPASATAAEGREAAEVVDPNVTYVESLSPASLAEYDLALFGDILPPDDLTPEELAEWEPQDPGCLGTARETVSGPAVHLDEDYQDLMMEAGALQSAVLDDPAVLEADSAWSDCMADAGHPDLSDPADARESISAALDDLWATVPHDSATAADLDPTALAELQEREIATALTDDTCQVDSGYRDVVLGRLHAAEEQFIADNRDRLDELKESFGR